MLPRQTRAAHISPSRFKWWQKRRRDTSPDWNYRPGGIDVLYTMLDAWQAETPYQPEQVEYIHPFR